MLEFVVFVLSLTVDQLVKFWALHYLIDAPGGTLPIIGQSFYFRYAENHGTDVSFFRSTHPLMYLFRLLQLVLVLFILIKYHKRISRWMRAGLALFLAGLVGNQINYLFMGFVPDMFYAPSVIRGIFNVADLLVLASMIILFIRLAFFEGTQIIDWLMKKLGQRKKKPTEGDPDA